MGSTVKKKIYIYIGHGTSEEIFRSNCGCKLKEIETCLQIHLFLFQPRFLQQTILLLLLQSLVMGLYGWKPSAGKLPLHKLWGTSSSPANVPWLWKVFLTKFLKTRSSLANDFLWFKFGEARLALFYTHFHIWFPSEVGFPTRMAWHQPAHAFGRCSGMVAVETFARNWDKSSQKF